MDGLFLSCAEVKKIPHSGHTNLSQGSSILILPCLILTSLFCVQCERTIIHNTVICNVTIQYATNVQFLILYY